MPDFPLSTETTNFFEKRGSRLVRFNSTFFTYEPSGYYRELDEELLRAEIRSAIEWQLKLNEVNSTIDEIKGATVIDSHGVELPLFLDGIQAIMPPARTLIVCRNGMLDPVAGNLYQHTDSLFTLNALPFDYAPSAHAPTKWLNFVQEVFDGDAKSIAELQKLFGYLLTLDTRLQKIFAIIGPTRSGKGTIGRVLEALLGKGNVCGPSFTKLGGDFGLQSFIGKQVAIIADARIGSRTDRMVVAERLLSISGEDSLDVARKHRTDWHGRLSTRILILSNELPALPDPSGSLSARFVAFYTPRSFLGHEDRELTSKLLGELPGILNWSLEGLRRVQSGDEIVTPTAARELIEGIEALGSPVTAFVKEQCSIDPTASTQKDTLWIEYRKWHYTNGIPGNPLSKEVFGRALKTAFSGTIKEHRPRATDDGPRPRHWSGIALAGPPSQPDIALTPRSPSYGNQSGPAAPPFGPCVVRVPVHE
tara:strand:+ start:2977 stop:4410 length:1434 start_codon:yes stop_codon:yes gene_type:complete